MNPVVLPRVTLPAAEQQVLMGINYMVINDMGINYTGINVTGINSMGINCTGINATGGSAPLPYKCIKHVSARCLCGLH